MPESGDIAARYLHTIRDFVRWGVSRMHEAGVHFGHGTDNGIDEAAALVLHALHLPPDLAELYFSSHVTPAEKHAVTALFERRISERIPAAYLTGQAWFMGLPFYVDERVLIPRSPLAEWIEQGLQPWVADPGAVASVLDIGTGSGCIGIACAYMFPQAAVDLVDISGDALEVARRNIEQHGLEERVVAVSSDIFSGLGEKRYDLIISNPPYVGAEELAQLPAEYHHEPALGLAAGASGLDIVRVILREAADHLTEHGLLVIEVGATWQTLEAAYPQVPFTWLDCAQGGEGVFLLTVAQLRTHAELFAAAKSG